MMRAPWPSSVPVFRPPEAAMLRSALPASTTATIARTTGQTTHESTANTKAMIALWSASVAGAPYPGAGPPAGP